jgi:hypothetical protein
MYMASSTSLYAYSMAEFWGSQDRSYQDHGGLCHCPDKASLACPSCWKFDFRKE